MPSAPFVGSAPTSTSPTRARQIKEHMAASYVRIEKHESIPDDIDIQKVDNLIASIEEKQRRMDDMLAVLRAQLTGGFVRRDVHGRVAAEHRKMLS